MPKWQHDRAQLCMAIYKAQNKIKKEGNIYTPSIYIYNIYKLHINNTIYVQQVLRSFCPKKKRLDC